MKFLLFDKSEKRIANLKEVRSARHYREVNGEDTLSLILTDPIEKGHRVIYRSKLGYWHEFIVRGVEETHTDYLEKSVFCESAFYETLGDFVEDKRSYDTTATAALESVLGTSRWQVGQVDNLGVNSANFYQISVMEAVQKIAQTWGGEIRTRVTVDGNKITGRYVDILARVGSDNGKRFVYSKDIESIKKTVARDDVITALYGYGRGEYIEETSSYGRRTTFADINGGKAYVEDLDALALWGRENGDGTKSHVFGKAYFDSITDETELLTATAAKLAELSKPLISYSAKVIDLKAYGFEHEGVDLGDDVAVIDRAFEPELRLKARVMALDEDLLENDSEVKIGNFLPDIADENIRLSEFVDQFRSRSGIWDRSNSFNSDGLLDTQYLQGVMDVTKNKLTSTQSGWYTDDQGNLVFDALDGSSSMMLSGSGFMIANTKLGNGEWDYRTFGTGDGFLADYIIAGTLLGGNVKWNLEDGTLLIGESSEDYQLLYDGTTLSINGIISPTSVQMSNIQTAGSNLLANPSWGGRFAPDVTAWYSGLLVSLMLARFADMTMDEVIAVIGNLTIAEVGAFQW